MPNDDKIIFFFKDYSSNPNDDYLEIVFCHLPDNELTPFVTWMHNKTDNAFYLGHYFPDMDDAIEDFLNRGPNKLGRS